MADDPGTAPVETPYGALPLEERGRRTTALLERGESDRRRWADARNLSAAWNMRAAAVAALITAPATILDLGCGAMALEAALPPGAIYVPADLVPRDARTLLFDVNDGPLPDVDADCVTALGVLEYVLDPERFLRAVHARWPRCIVTYHPVAGDGPWPRRRTKGWFNDLSHQALVRCAVRAGFGLASAERFGKGERIYDFRRIA